LVRCLSRGSVRPWRRGRDNDPALLIRLYGCICGLAERDALGRCQPKVSSDFLRKISCGSKFQKCLEGRKGLDDG